MAILTVSRQVASLGDELCKSIAARLGYRFVSRKDIERKILSLGFPKFKLEKFDERKPGFLSSLTSERDEYLDYLQLAILESAADDNCVIIGRGAFIILKDLPNHISLKFVSDKKIRISRYESEHNCSKRVAEKNVNEIDANRDGFNKSFFNFDINNPAMFHLVVNTGLIETEAITLCIETIVKAAVSPQKTLDGHEMIKNQLLVQKIVNLLKYKHGLEIKFLRTEIDGAKIVLHGIADSNIEIEKTVQAVRNMFPGYQIVSAFQKMP